MEHALQKKELSDTKRVLEELKREHELKSKECQEAWKSLKELQKELMRKSMHVGSLGEEVILKMSCLHSIDYYNYTIDIHIIALFADFRFCSFCN